MWGCCNGARRGKFAEAAGVAKVQQSYIENNIKMMLVILQESIIRSEVKSLDDQERCCTNIF
jgi:hypothetical protein